MKRLQKMLLVIFIIFGSFIFSIEGVRAGLRVSPMGDAPPGAHRTGQNIQSSETRFYLPLIRKGFYPRLYEDSIFGVENSTVQPDNWINEMIIAGSKWVRINGLIWSEAEPVEGQIDWQSDTIKKMEKELLEANKLGVELIYIVRGTPEWARKYPASECGPIKEEKLAAFGDFMGQMVAHFSASPYDLIYWEMGNEPDVAVIDGEWVYGCWGETGDEYFGGGYYGDMLKQVYPIMKTTHPDIEVLVGGLLLDCDPVNPPEDPPGSGEFKDCTSSKFLQGILENGGGPYFDGVSFHSYGYYQGGLGKYSNSNWHSSWDTTGPVVNAKTSYLKDMLENYGQSDKYLISTEISLVCDTGCTDNFEATKANYLAQAYADSSFLGLRAAIWYDIRGNWRNSGLIQDNEFMPAYEAYRISHQEIEPAQQVIDISDDWLRGYEFQFSGHRVWVIWSGDGLGHNYILPGTPYSIKDIFGNVLTHSQTIYVDNDVLYVEWLP